jgi:hypothetical protein
MQFKEISFPGILLPSYIPEDITLILPNKSELPQNQQHFLLNIPWKDKYLDLVPVDFRDFFSTVLPYIHTRTTDVHTAISLGNLNTFINKLGKPINRRVVAVALCLHDAGWSQLSEQEIAESLGIKGLKLSGTALNPKQKHAVKSIEIARQTLQTYPNFNPPLTPEEQELICKAVLYHDKPEEVAGSQQPIPLEVQAVVDLDHLWAFTHENFWQDTLRKGVPPPEYLKNLSQDLNSYFVTPEGKKLASELLSQRTEEVKIWKRKYSF